MFILFLEYFMNQATHRRHDISDKNWNAIKEKLPGATGKVGRPSYDNRLFINAVFWILGQVHHGGTCLLSLRSS